MSKTSRRKAPAHVEGCIAARAFRRRIVRLFDAIDLLLCPAWPFPAPHLRGDERDIAMQGIDGVTRYTQRASLASGTWLRPPPSPCRGASMWRGSHSPFSSSGGSEPTRRCSRSRRASRSRPPGAGCDRRSRAVSDVRSHVQPGEGQCFSFARTVNAASAICHPSRRTPSSAPSNAPFAVPARTHFSTDAVRTAAVSWSPARGGLPRSSPSTPPRLIASTNRAVAEEVPDMTLRADEHPPQHGRQRSDPEKPTVARGP